MALGSEQLKQGLLTYALVLDGLEARQAVKPGTKEITLDSWLEYGLERVPKLYEEVLQGKVQTFETASKDVKVDEEPSPGVCHAKEAHYLPAAQPVQLPKALVRSAASINV